MKHPTSKTQAQKELLRLRNRHVAKLLTYLGEVPPYMEAAIKKALSMFAEDVDTNIIHSDNSEVHNDRNDRS